MRIKSRFFYTKSKNFLRFPLDKPKKYGMICSNETFSENFQKIFIIFLRFPLDKNSSGEYNGDPTAWKYFHKIFLDIYIFRQRIKWYRKYLTKGEPDRIRPRSTIPDRKAKNLNFTWQMKYFVRKIAACKRPPAERRGGSPTRPQR